MKVLITGGAGFLGRGIIRRFHNKWDITVYSRDETKQDECRRRYPNVRYILGDVRDVERLASAMWAIDHVIHAAAMKYIPDAELNAAECVAVNVDGTRAVIAAAKKAGVSRVVGISTDKACQPVNIYGASKMVMERLFADEIVLRPEDEKTIFTTVRYGNVIGSTGSVIPLFRRQAQEYGRVFITDLRMTRFWMTIEEAIDTITLGFAASPGAVVVPRPRAMTIVDVARAATKDDIEVVEIGQRPGEKLHETLLHHEESVRAVKRDAFYELLPVNTEAAKESFTVASHTSARAISVREMREAIDDAERI